MSKNPLKIRKMRAEDIEAGMRLKAFPKWNQLPNDWHGLMNLDHNGCFVGEVNSFIAGTATGLRYDANLGWIGMVLVDPEYRRQGIASKLMNYAIEYLETSPCSCLKLDATDAGAKVYERMGFDYEYQVERWLGTHTGCQLPEAGSPTSSNKADLSAEKAVRPINPKDIERIAQWDQSIFGANRKRLLRWYSENSAPAYWSCKEDTPTGFILGRPGSNAFQIGPLTADNPDVAEVLFKRFLDKVPEGPVIVDISVPNKAATIMLEKFGFERFRVLQRMYKGENLNPGKPEHIFCLAGFEFG